MVLFNNLFGFRFVIMRLKMGRCLNKTYNNDIMKKHYSWLLLCRLWPWSNTCNNLWNCVNLDDLVCSSVLFCCFGCYVSSETGLYFVFATLFSAILTLRPPFASKAWRNEAADWKDKIRFSAGVADKTDVDIWWKVNSTSPRCPQARFHSVLKLLLWLFV